MLFKKIVLFILCFTTITTLYAATCPPPDLIKAAMFNRAEVYDSESDIWELISEPFMFDGVQWDVSYGLTIPNVVNTAEALQRGQQLYHSAAIIHPYPTAIPIPGYLFCEYTEEDMTYWIQALSPPGK